MTTFLENLYQHSPIPFQNLMANLYGLQQTILRHGGNYQKYCLELNESQWWNVERLQEYQDERVRALVWFCYHQVPYYKKMFTTLGLLPSDIQTATDLKKLPILEKETVRDTPELFKPRQLSERIVPQTTGGTTGTPLRYFATPSAIQYNFATYEVRCRHWAGVKFRDRTATINGKIIVPIEQTKPPFWRHNVAFNQIYFSAYHLQAEYLPYYINRLHKFSPQVIVGYASTVHAIAKFIIEHDKIGIVSPKAVIVSSETLFDWARQDIETAFQCKLFDAYSLGELVSFITQCEAGSMHISPEYGVVELIEMNGNYEMVCTGLFNYAMPLLRYRTGDIVEPGDGQICSCGRQLPTVKNILGRIDDLLVTPEGVMIGPAALSLVFQDVPNLIEAQIVQKDPSKIVIYLVTTKFFLLDNKNFLLEELHKRFGYTLQIDLVFVDQIPRTGAGKKRLVVSKCVRNWAIS